MITLTIGAIYFPKILSDGHCAKIFLIDAVVKGQGYFFSELRFNKDKFVVILHLGKVTGDSSSF